MPIGAGYFPGTGGAPNQVYLGGNYFQYNGLYDYVHAGLGQEIPPEVAIIGGRTGTTGHPDVTYNQTTAVPLWPANRIPGNQRVYVTALTAQLLGDTPWTNTSGANPGILISDSATIPNPVAYIPLSALIPYSKISFPENATVAPFIFGSSQTITATYSAAGPTLTLSGNGLVTTLLGGLFVTVMDDSVTPAAVGQSMQIASNTASVITLSGAFSIAPSTSAIYNIQYFTATSGSGTTAVIPLAANVAAHAAQGYSLVMAQGTGAGQFSTISDNTTTTMTFASRNTAAASGTLFQLTTNPGNLGAIEFGIATGQMQLALGSPLIAQLVGVQAGGSPVRITWEGYLAK